MPKKKLFSTLSGHKKTVTSGRFNRPSNKGRSYINLDHEKTHSRLLAAGNWCETAMLTLTSRPAHPHWRSTYFEDMWIETLRIYYGMTKKIVSYHFVANNGKAGKEQASAHIMFEEPLPDLDLIKRIWESNRFGLAKLTDAGGEVSKYIAKNIVEDSDSIERSSKWRDHERKREKSLVTIPPIGRRGLQIPRIAQSKSHPSLRKLAHTSD